MVDTHFIRLPLAHLLFLANNINLDQWHVKVYNLTLQLYTSFTL